MKTCFALATALTLLACCAGTADEPSAGDISKDLVDLQPHPDLSRWAGSYVSTKEATDSYAMHLDIDTDYLDGIAFKRKFRSVMPSPEGSVRSETVNGSVHVERDRLYLPIPHALEWDAGIRLSAFIQVFNRATIGGRVVLLTDKALDIHRQGRRLDGHGVLIRCDHPLNDSGPEQELLSVNCLYDDPSEDAKK